MASEYEQLYEQLLELNLDNVRVMAYPNMYYGALGRYREDYENWRVEIGQWYVISGPDRELPQSICAVGTTPEEAFRNVIDKIKETNWQDHQRRRIT